jgi:hypothetical protein
MRIVGRLSKAAVRGAYRNAPYMMIISLNPEELQFILKEQAHESDVEP